MAHGEEDVEGGEREHGEEVGAAWGGTGGGGREDGEEPGCGDAAQRKREGRGAGLR